MKENNTLCHCGCGRETNLDHRGQPRRFLRGHNRRGTSKGWIEQGRWYVSVNGKKIAHHRHLYQQWYGVTLRPNQVVHHADGNPFNNDPANLVAMTRPEHMRVHGLKDSKERWTPNEDARLLALRAAGMTIQRCSFVLGRSYSGTQARLAKLIARGNEAANDFREAA